MLISRIPTCLIAAEIVLVWSLGVRAEGFAVVVGVNECPKFRLPDGTRPRSLRGAESDAEAFAAVLIRDYGFAARNVQVMKGDHATREAIRKALHDTAKRVRPGDSLVFYFAGHGTQVPDRRPFDEPDDLDEALCPSDADDGGGGLVLDDDLGLWLDEVEAGQVTVILDCCHSGTGTKAPDDDLMPRFLPGNRVGGKPAAESPWRELRDIGKAPGRQMIALFACRPDQHAYERLIPGKQPPTRGGLFSYYFLEGLHDAAADLDGDGVVQNKEILQYVAKRLNESFNEARPSLADRQQPTLETDFPEASVIGPLPRSGSSHD